MNSKNTIDNFFEEFIAFQTTYMSEVINEDTGLSIEIINKIQSVYDVELPYTYLKFLELFGGNGLRIFGGQTYDPMDIIDAHEVKSFLCERDNVEFPQNAFPISQWQGYNFWFINNEDNPKVYLFMEAGNDPEKKPAEITDHGTLTEWLLEKTENFLAMEKQIHNRNIEKELSVLNTLRII